jgi:hypothetical protein
VAQRITKNKLIFVIGSNFSMKKAGTKIEAEMVGPQNKSIMDIFPKICENKYAILTIKIQTKKELNNG